MRLVLSYQTAGPRLRICDMHLPPFPCLQAGSWSQRFHRYCPPAFKAATAELLRISHKHGGSVRSGRLVWPFNCDMLVSLLLPVLEQDMTAWL